MDYVLIFACGVLVAAVIAIVLFIWFMANLLTPR